MARDQQAEPLALTVVSVKQSKPTFATQYILSQRAELRCKFPRFDVAAVTGSEGPGALEWAQDASQPD